jgi:hypothetical protein
LRVFAGDHHAIFIRAPPATTALRLIDWYDSQPNVAALPQRWAEGHNAVGVDSISEHKPFVHQKIPTATRLWLFRFHPRPDGHNRVAVVFISEREPKVGVARQPWAGGCNPFGIEKR